MYLLIRAHYAYRIAALNGNQRLVGHGEHILAFAHVPHTHSSVLAGSQDQIGIGNQPLYLESSGTRIHLPVRGNDHAAVFVHAAIAQYDLQVRVPIVPWLPCGEPCKLLLCPG